MPGRRNKGRRGIRIHRSYSVDEVSRILQVAQGTIRRWIKGEKLPALTERKPMLILGSELALFLSKSRASRQPCKPHECYCVKCRKPQHPAGDMAEYVPLAPITGNLRALCPVCGLWMHKRIRRDALIGLEGLLSVTTTVAPLRINGLNDPSLNDHLP